MFDEPKQKNRRMNAKEFEQELQESKIWGHIPRKYILDRPFYTNIPITPIIPKLNFDLNWTE